MHPSTRWRWQWTLCIAGMIACLLSGCGGIDMVALKESQIEELQYQNTRQREALKESLETTERRQQEIKGLSEENSRLAEEVENLRSQVRLANEEAKKANKERDDALAEVKRLEDRTARTQQNLAKIKAVASASATELADLRLRRAEFEKQLGLLRTSETSLRAENQTLASELKKTTEELVRSGAVIRSLRGEGNNSAQVLKSALTRNDQQKERIEWLQQQNAELKRRLETAASSTGDAKLVEALPLPVNPPAAKAPRATKEEQLAENLQGTLSKFGSLLRERYYKALRGDIAWDTFDLVVVGMIGVFILFVIWGLVRRGRMRKLGKHLRVLNARVMELEQIQVEGPASPPAVAGGGGARRHARGGAPALRARRSSGARRTGFSAVISSRDYASRGGNQPMAPQGGSGKQEPAAESQVSGQRQAPAEAATLKQVLAEVTDVNEEREPAVGQVEPRRVIGARTWEKKPAPAQRAAEKPTVVEPPPQDDLASTQIIPQMGDDAPDVALPGVEAEEASGATAAAAPEPRQEGGSRDDDQALLDELKAVVNKKFDELVK